ncbi:AAA family ATPase [Pimelobacter simplex]|uniref:AAA family ATPase n=1 Tax=Nocardioides simplex TaxID=2045 RepID=A0A7J5E4W1_NOCSI|nr:AAA family ATPase [Pimelobacter simplex]KAB2813203.1 AAA family ATPase [Pimelobacter simplex]
MAVISERLARAVRVHIYRNYAVGGLGPTPLILGIDGPPGEGKTYSVQAVAEQEAGIRTFHVSGGQLESPHAGRPAELLRDTYREAGDAVLQGLAVAAVVVVDDVDTGIGDWGDLVQYTVNRQTVVGELMHLCDFPEVVAGRPSPRVPIIVTGNDFSRLYGPLIRSGRFRRMTWRPNFEEKRDIVAGFYPSSVAGAAGDLVALFPERPVAFFADVLSAALDELVWPAIQERGLAAVLDAARAGSHPVVHGRLTFRLLAEVAADLANQRVESHLEVR